MATGHIYPLSSNSRQQLNLATGGSRAFSHGYNAAGRLSELRVGGALQARYHYDAMGRQAIRSLVSGQVIHSVFDSMGRRVAEYSETPGALLREYVWLGWEPVAVIEGGVIHFIRTDHIGRPVLATDSTGTVVWTASYDPFGTVHASTGTPTTIRFLGQWFFQAESGLHQNWMRDYDPTTGRYIQADPLGLVDGPSVYGYAAQNPGRWTDPTGELIPQAVACLINPWCRSAVGAAAGLIYGFLVDDDGCYTWGEMAYYAGLGATSYWGAGKGAAPLFGPTGPFRPGSWLNSGGHFRIGWGRAPGNRTVFRAAGGSPKAGNHWHIDMYFP